MAERRKIHIDPLSRVEGHASISILFDDAGSVADARLHVSEFRGFETFCEGRLVWEMPRLTSRICGVCPVSHAVTSARAGDDILAVAIPRTAEQLRRVLLLAQWVQSHALSFFHFSSPDLLLGFDAPSETRNMFAMMEDHSDFIRRGIRLRKWGQEFISRITGKRIHADYVLPGGVRSALSEQERDIILDGLPEAHVTIRQAIEFMKSYLEAREGRLQLLGDFPSLFMGLVGEDGALEYYDGTLRVIDSSGGIVADHLPPNSYRDFIAESIEPWSYLNFPYYAPHGPVDGMYRVGSLARLNLSSHTGSPKSDRELIEFRERAGENGTVTNSFYTHYARLIEILFALERIEELLTDAESLRSDTLRARAFSNRQQGIGCTEAPRGTLFHNYTVSKDGVVTKVDLLIATAQNNLAMNKTIQQIATQLISDPDVEVTEGMLNTIEAGIRAYDPCFSCSTHALGHMPLRLAFRRSDGTLLRSFAR